MTPQDLTNARKAMKLNQTEMAGYLDMSLRGYRKLETGESPIRAPYVLAVCYLSMMLAADSEDISRALPRARGDALRLAQLITGG